MFQEYFKVSFLMMRSKPVRSVLSLLGIYIGVMALIVILAIREGIRDEIEKTFHTEGARVILIQPGFDQVARRIGRLTSDDLEELKRVRGVESVFPRQTSEYDVRSRSGLLHAHAVGVDAGFISLYRVPVLRGRVFFQDEIDKKQAVCLITAEAANKLFPSSEPIGASIEIAGDPFQVIGVVTWPQDVRQRTSVYDADVLMPISFWNVDESQMLGMVEVRASLEMSTAQAKERIVQALSHGDRSREAMFFVRSLEESLEFSRQSSDRILVGLLGIAAISLLVGGIGVANVMVTNVTERTREIGIRKALGARRIDILFQFLVESSLLCGTGGVLAALTGGAALMIVHATIDIQFPLTLTPLSVSFCVALTFVIGLIAGIYPASRAAGLSPAEALRYE